MEKRCGTVWLPLSGFSARPPPWRCTPAQGPGPFPSLPPRARLGLRVHPAAFRGSGRWEAGALLGLPPWVLKSCSQRAAVTQTGPCYSAPRSDEALRAWRGLRDGSRARHEGQTARDSTGTECPEQARPWGQSADWRLQGRVGAGGEGRDCLMGAGVPSGRRERSGTTQSWWLPNTQCYSTLHFEIVHLVFVGLT